MLTFMICGRHAFDAQEKQAPIESCPNFFLFSRVAHHLGTFRIQAEPVDLRNLQFHGDFSILCQRHFRCQGRRIQCESFCRPFVHVSHATLFIFHPLYKRIGNTVSICADEIITDAMAAASNGAGCKRQHGHRALKFM